MPATDSAFSSPPTGISSSANSTLRPPRAQGHLSSRTACDIHSPLGGGRHRPTSEVFAQAPLKASTPEADVMDKFLQELTRFEATLEEMAAASLDQNFKEELSAIEQWFRVLSEAERTAALYSLLQQTSQVQIRFFITVLQQMAKSDPMGAILSPANFERDAMQNHLSQAMNQATIDHKTPSIRPPASPGLMRGASLDPDTISQMFPDAAAALEKQRARLKANGGMFGDTGNARQSPNISRDIPGSPKVWSVPSDPTRPKSADIQQWHPPQSATFPVRHGYDTEPSPFTQPGASWASMVNTPMVPMFGASLNNSPNPNDFANATSTKLAAWSTGANPQQRVVLESDVKKFRRGKSPITTPNSHGHGNANYTSSPTMVMYDENGNFVQVGSQYAQVSTPLRKSSPRASSPFQPSYGGTPGWCMPSLSSPQPNAYLVASPVLEGYLSDQSSSGGRRNANRRGSTKVLEDPTDINLLADIPAWLRSLRLHKYTDNFKDMNWKDLVQLTDSDLEKQGVAALGARRKMLKVFEQVKEAQNAGKLDK